MRALDGSGVGAGGQLEDLEGRHLALAQAVPRGPPALQHAGGNRRVEGRDGAAAPRGRHGSRKTNREALALTGRQVREALAQPEH